MNVRNGIVVLAAAWLSNGIYAFSPFRKDSGSSGSLSTTDTDHEDTASERPSNQGSRRPDRGQLLSDTANEHELYEAYAAIQADYESKAFASQEWQILNEQHGVTVSLLHHPDDPTCPYVKMRGIIPVPMDSCWNFLRVDHWDRNMPKMDPFYEGVHVHGEYQVSVAADRPHPLRPEAVTMATTGSRTMRHPEQRTVRMILCRKRMKRLLTFGKRDLVFLSVTEDEPLADGTRVSGTVSVRTSRIPRVPGYTRAFQDSIAFYQPIANGTATDLTIVCRIDLNDSGENGQGGGVPMWLYVKTIGRTAAASIHQMRQALVSDHANASV